MFGKHPGPITTGLLLALGLGACSGNGGASSSASSAGAGSGSASAASSELDLAFIDMMVPHHQSAVEMATIAQQRASREELRGLASEIVRAQEEEIAKFRAWRLDWFGSDATPPLEAMPLMPGLDMSGMEGNGTNGTMDMSMDVEALRRAEPFDRAFIEAMIPHHETAVAAARLIAGATERTELKEMAADIIEAQEREIDQLEGWLREWYPT